MYRRRPHEHNAGRIAARAWRVAVRLGVDLAQKANPMRGTFVKDSQLTFIGWTVLGGAALTPSKRYVSRVPTGLNLKPSTVYELRQPHLWYLRSASAP